MQLPIDTSNPRQPHADANGEPVYGVDVVAFGAEAPQIWPAKISGQHRGVAVGQADHGHGPYRHRMGPWGRSGIAFRAVVIAPVAVPQKAAA